MNHFHFLDFPETHLVVIGKSPNESKIRKLIKDLGLYERITFKSNLSEEEIVDIYHSSQIAVIPSLYEGFGYPVIEAMSCEVPLIATNVSSIPELTSEFATLIEPKNEEMIYKSVKNILSDYDEFKQIAINGRAHVIKKFNWAKITNEYEDVIFKTIKKFRDANV